MKHRQKVFFDVFLAGFTSATILLFVVGCKKNGMDRLMSEVSECQTFDALMRQQRWGSCRVLPSTDIETLEWYGMKGTPPPGASNLTVFVLSTRSVPIRFVFAFVDPQSSNIVSIAYGHP